MSITKSTLGKSKYSSTKLGKLVCHIVGASSNIVPRLKQLIQEDRLIPSSKYIVKALAQSLEEIAATELVSSRLHNVVNTPLVRDFTAVCIYLN